MKDSCDSYIIRVSCPATSGIISAVTSFLSEHDCYISELAQYDDEELQNFFLRAKFRFNEGVSGDIETLRDEFAAIAKDNPALFSSLLFRTPSGMAISYPAALDAALAPVVRAFTESDERARRENSE